MSTLPVHVRGWWLPPLLLAALSCLPGDEECRQQRHDTQADGLRQVAAGTRWAWCTDDELCTGEDIGAEVVRNCRAVHHAREHASGSMTCGCRSGSIVLAGTI